MPTSMSSMVMTKTAVVATPTIEAVMEVYVRTIIPIRPRIITRMIITRIHDTPAQKYRDKYQKEKFFHLAPPLDAFLVL